MVQYDIGRWHCCLRVSTKCKIQENIKYRSIEMKHIVLSPSLKALFLWLRYRILKYVFILNGRVHCTKIVDLILVGKSRRVNKLPASTRIRNRASRIICGQQTVPHNRHVHAADRSTQQTCPHSRHIYADKLSLRCYGTTPTGIILILYVSTKKAHLT